MEFTVYILFSPSKNKYYFGQTNNLQRRLKDHNSCLSTYTRSGVPWELVYTKKCVDRSEAVQLERKLKSMKSKFFLEEMIKTKSVSTV